MFMDNKKKQKKMMYLMLTLFVGLCVLAWYQKLKKLEDTKKKPFLWKTGFTLVLLSVIFLTVTGRLHWIGAAITAVIPILAFLFRWSRRIFPLLKIFGGIKQKPSQFKTKTLQIRMIQDLYMLSQIGLLSKVWNFKESAPSFYCSSHKVWGLILYELAFSEVGVYGAENCGSNLEHLGHSTCSQIQVPIVE